MKLKKTLLFLVAIFGVSVATYANTETGSLPQSIIADQHYNKAIHIMAMLLLGFGFLMVFVRKYGRSALTATFLLVSVALPLYIVSKGNNFLGESHSEIDNLIFAEFGAASLLIAAGAVLGRLKMQQYLFLGMLFIPAYMFNEWLVLENGLSLVPAGSVVDTGGSIVIHAFGAIFGLGVALTMTTKQDYHKTIESDSTSDRYSMLGSMVLWVFWPSFCSALVPPEMVPHTVVNVIIALCGSTIATYILSVRLRKKISIADIANAALAGGVAIGSTCANATYSEAAIVGIMAGSLSTFGFAVIQSKTHKWMKLIDTCGVSNLHGLPGLMGGLAALPIVHGINIGGQLSGIGITVAVAIITGLVAGKLIALLGHRDDAYDDAEEFIDAES